jgi:hypothetical protein
MPSAGWQGRRRRAVAEDYTPEELALAERIRRL